MSRSERFFNLTYFNKNRYKSTDKVFRVRKSSIDIIMKKASYTTLVIGGEYVNVCEDADWIQNVCEREDQR